jgi:NADH-quinone oxidoreductase subunit G
VPACGFIGEGANSVGGYVAKALPTALNAYEMFAQPRKAYILLGVEPELDCHNPQQAVAALKGAALVVSLTPFSDGAARDYADVLLPIAPFYRNIRLLCEHGGSSSELQRCRSPIR